MVDGRRILLGGLVAAVVSTLALTGLATGASQRPPCTRTAVTAALHRDAQRDIRRGRIPVGSLRCAGRYATAGEIVGPRPNQVEITVVFRMQGSRWQVISRATPCRRHWIPRKIYRAACESN
jgi:hypothetical protein